MDLNADIGELPGENGRRLDRMILSAVTSCNVACGGHAGDVDTMRATLKAAKSNNLRIGAHPSYPDRDGFGRRHMDISISDLEASLTEQVSNLVSLAREEDVEVTHVKPHGALYNFAAKNTELANCVARVTASYGIPFLFGLPNSEIKKSADAIDLKFVAEGFVDRAYNPDGSLVSRAEDGAVFGTSEKIVGQAVEIAKTQSVCTLEGEQIDLQVQTLCLHGDTEGAALEASKIRNALETANVSVSAYV